MQGYISSNHNRGSSIIPSTTGMLNCRASNLHWIQEETPKGGTLLITLITGALSQFSNTCTLHTCSSKGLDRFYHLTPLMTVTTFTNTFYVPDTVIIIVHH